jgi:hypothetical protein
MLGPRSFSLFNAPADGSTAVVEPCECAREMCDLKQTRGSGLTA